MRPIFVGIISSESVLSIWTEARGTSIQGLTSRGLFPRTSAISDADGRLVGAISQQLCSKEVLIIEYRI